MLSDLAALTPPLIVGVAFVIWVVLFMRRQLGPRTGTDDRAGAEIPDDHGDRGNTGPVEHPAAPPADHPKL